jgi:hypothetical protein
MKLNTIAGIKALIFGAVGQNDPSLEIRIPVGRIVTQTVLTRPSSGVLLDLVYAGRVLHKLIEASGMARRWGCSTRSDTLRTLHGLRVEDLAALDETRIVPFSHWTADSHSFSTLHHNSPFLARRG